MNGVQAAVIRRVYSRITPALSNSVCTHLKGFQGRSNFSPDIHWRGSSGGLQPDCPVRSSASLCSQSEVHKHQKYSRTPVREGMVTSALDSCVPAASTPVAPSTAAVMEPLVACEELTNPGQIKTLLASIDDVIFDCDGVLWHGDNLLPGVQETLAELQRAGKRLFYVTNNASKSRSQYAEKIQRLGIKKNPRHVYGSAYAAASYLKRLGFRKKVFVVGMEGIEKELDEAGIRHTAGSSYVAPGETVDDAAGIELDPEVGAVVVGFDSRANYCKLAAASQYILYNPGCLFIATNTDAAANASNGRIIPGAGTLVRAIQLATGRDPIVMGKPEPFLLDAIADEHRIHKERTLMVGDRLDTDIEFGFNYGIRTLLVYTGVTTPELLRHRLRSKVEPTYVCSSVASLNVRCEEQVHLNE